MNTPPVQARYVDASNPEVRTFWEKKLTRAVARTGPLLNPALGILGKTSSHGIQIKDDLAKNAGGNIRLTIVHPLRGAGRGPGEKLSNHTEGQSTGTFDVKVNKLRHAVSVEDEMTDQYIPYSALDEATEALGPWYERRMNFCLTAQATGLTQIDSDKWRGNNDIRAIHPSHISRPNQRASGEALTVNDGISHAFVQAMALKLKVGKTRMRPMRLKGAMGGTFLWMLSPQNVMQMQETDSAFFTAMIAAMANSAMKENPLFSDRALGKWGPFTFIEHDLLPGAINTGTDEIIPNTTRGFILGAQGLVKCFGRGRRPRGYSNESRYQLIPDDEDFGDTQMVGAKTIWGCARPGYTDPREDGQSGQQIREQGIMVVETFADGKDNEPADIFEEYVEAGIDLQSSGYPGE